MENSHTDRIGILSDLLTRAGYSMATAESCTGGMIAAMCTDIAGSSAWFMGGVVSYANEIKESLLGVPPAVLETHGAVSGEVVRHMAAGALHVCGAQAAVAVSGIAGPGGGTPEKPVGTAWFALAVRDGRMKLRRSLYPRRSRREVQLCATRTALDLLLCGLRASYDVNL